MTNEVKEAISAFKEWIERDKKIEYADRLENIEIYNLAIKALEQTTWIPVSERLPELGEVVLIYDEAFGYLTAIYSEVVDDYDERIPCFSTHYSISSDKWAIMHPIAWMPLPEPCKAESEDEG